MRLDPVMTWCPETGAVRHVTDQLLRDSYLAPRHLGFPVSETLDGSSGPWSASYSVAPEETTRAVERALRDLAGATTTLEPNAVSTEVLPDSRARTHLAALRGLWADMEGALPEELATTRHVLHCSAKDALEPLPLLQALSCPFATAAERALAEQLTRHHGLAPDNEKRVWNARQPASTGTAPGALGHIQTHLARATAPSGMDATLAVHGLREPIEEAEFAAARAQRLLEAGVVDAVHEIGILVPENPLYHGHLARAFDSLGIPLAGLPETAAARDPAGECLTALLAILREPQPRTALASFHVSPLMPWPRATGTRMAREIIERGWSRTATDYTGPGVEILANLRPVESAAQLIARLFAVVEQLCPDPDLMLRLGQMRAVVGDGPIDWATLYRIAGPRPRAAEGNLRFVEGVSLFREAALPWRPVRHLIVLGLAGPSWPRRAPVNPFFTESEIEMIRGATGLRLPGRRQSIERGLELFRRQLCAATEGATFLVPARDASGTALATSTGLTLIARAIGVRDEQDLIREVRDGAPEKWPVTSRAATPVANGGAPELPTDGVIQLGRDLMLIRTDEDGRMAPQSPSRLETLIVSPLAWLLDETDARDRTWAPEALDVLTLGTVIHHILEVIFPSGQAVPDDDAIAERLDAAFADAIRRQVPWLAGDGWAIERESLAREALGTALAWARFLRGAGAEIVENEIHLAGEQHGLRLAGRADSLLRLPDGRVMVVDHKRSSSGRRRERMSKGWDLQVALYRAMLERPERETTLTRAIADGARPVTAYHLMLDGTVLTDAEGANIPGAEAAGEDASVEALAHLANVVAMAGAGTVMLNRASDVKAFDKERGINAYALKENDFVMAFLLPVDEEAADV